LFSLAIDVSVRQIYHVILQKYNKKRFDMPKTTAIILPHFKELPMSHYPESHLSTLSHAIMRMSREYIHAALNERAKVIMKIRPSSCLEDRIQSNSGKTK
jgi:hypothetical protein